MCLIRGDDRELETALISRNLRSELCMMVRCYAGNEFACLINLRERTIRAHWPRFLRRVKLMMIDIKSDSESQDFYLTFYHQTLLKHQAVSRISIYKSFIVVREMNN
jgi:hypothetical protein